jgi:hypothetical protein
MDYVIGILSWVFYVSAGVACMSVAQIGIVPF